MKDDVKKKIVAIITRLMAALFRERNNLKNEYSGNEDASLALRIRLSTTCSKFITSGYIGENRYFIPHNDIVYSLKINLLRNDLSDVLTNGSYDQVFEAIEIVLELGVKKLSSSRYYELVKELDEAFRLSGSVYEIDSGQINLRLDKELAKSIKEVEKVLKSNKTSYDTFIEAIGGLISREEKPTDVVKDVYIAFENYVREITGKSDFSGSINELQKRGTITNNQKVILDKIQAYRSNSYGIGHAGASKEPDEIDALWFIDTVSAQIKLIDKRTKTAK